MTLSRWIELMLPVDSRLNEVSARIETWTAEPPSQELARDVEEVLTEADRLLAGVPPGRDRMVAGATRDQVAETWELKLKGKSLREMSPPELDEVVSHVDSIGLGIWESLDRLQAGEQPSTQLAERRDRLLAAVDVVVAEQEARGEDLVLNDLRRWKGKLDHAWERAAQGLEATLPKLPEECRKLIWEARQKADGYLFTRAKPPGSARAVHQELKELWGRIEARCQFDSDELAMVLDMEMFPFQESFLRVAALAARDPED